MSSDRQAAFRSFLERDSGFWGSCLKEGLLRPLSYGYRAIISLRNHAFDRGWLQSQRPFAPYIISVGNIAAGGVGKTPLVLFLASLFSSEGAVAILSRGYRSRNSARVPLLVSDSKGPLFSAAFCGDEPYLLASKLPGIPLLIGKERVAAAYRAEELGASLLIVDDGFQHRWLGRDCDIVVVDGRQPLALGHLLPRGLLREGSHGLQRASLIVAHHIRSRFHFEEVRSLLARYSSAPIVATALEVAKLASSVSLPPSLKDVPVALFCAIGSPSSFVETVEALGAFVASSRFFGDHAPLTAKQLIPFGEEARRKGAKWLICTEKDAVKIAPFADELPLPLLWPEVELKITAGEEEWDAWKDKISRELAEKALELVRRETGCDG